MFTLSGLYIRCKKIIASCNTLEQYIVAKRYCQLARNTIMYSNVYSKEKTVDRMYYHNKIQDLIWWLDYKIKQK